MQSMERGLARRQRRRVHSVPSDGDTGHLKTKRGLFNKPKGVKCAQSKRCFNKLGDAKGGHEECDSDGEDCEAFCIRGYSYNVNEMRCQSVFLEDAKKNQGNAVTASVAAPAAPSASGLPIVPQGDTTDAILPVVPKADSGLPVVPSADEAIAKENKAAAGALPVVPKAEASASDASAQEASSTTSSNKSSSSSYSSSWSSSSSDGEVVKENPKIAQKAQKEEGVLPVVPAATSSASDSSTTSDKSEDSTPKTTTNEASKVVDQIPPAPTPEAAKSTATEGDLKEPAAPVAGPRGSDTEKATAASTSAPPTPTSDNSAEDSTVENGQSAEGAGGTSAVPAVTSEPTAGVNAESANGAKEEVAETLIEGDNAKEPSIADTAASFQEETDFTSEEMDDTAIIEDDNHISDDGVASITNINIEEQLDGHEEDGNKEDQEETKSEPADPSSTSPAPEEGPKDKQEEKAKDARVSASMSAAAAASAAAAGDGSLANWQDSLDAATGGVTYKEKVAIGTGCAAVAVFALVIIWALMNRQRVSGIFKRRTWASMKGDDDGGKRGSCGIDSEASWTVSDWEKMDQRTDANRMIRNSDNLTPRMSGQSMAGIGTLRHLSTAHTRHGAAAPQGANDSEGEELGYDWLELASEGRGLSPNSTNNQQSRFSASPRKRSFITTSILSSPGIVAKAFRIIVPIDKKAPPPLMKPPSGRKIFKNGKLLSPESARSPPVALHSPPGSGRQVREGRDSPARTPPRGEQARSRGPPTTPPKQYRTPANPSQQAIKNPFDDVEEAWSPAGSPPSHALTRRTSLPYRQAGPPKELPQRSNMNASPFENASEAPMEIEYVNGPRSSTSESSHGGHSSLSTLSLALPGCQTPPMTPLSGRGPRPSISSEPEELQAHMMVNHQSQRTMDFRAVGQNDVKDQEEETFPEDAEGYDLGEEEGEYEEEAEEDEEGRRQGTSSYGNTEMDSWYTRSSTLPPNLLDSVPITQEEIRKSRSPNTVRFAE